MSKKYDLLGFIVVTSWYGNHGFIKLHIITDEQGFKKINEDPLQDYTNFGVKEVNYAEFEIYETQIEEDANFIIYKESKNPIGFITKGTLPKNVNFNTDQFLEIPPEKVYYCLN